MDKISIIIPVYNVEDYVSRCLDSVTKQTYTNLEILIINDGSTDGSGKICDEYAAKDNRIRVFRKNNGGLSSALNAGLKVFTGDYLSFVDPDDWVETDMFAVLHSTAKRYNTPISIAGYYEDTDSRSTPMKNRKRIPEGIISKKNMLLYPLQRDNYMGFCGYVWNKLYKADTVKNSGIFFDEGIRYGMDVLFNISIVLAQNCEGAYTDKSIYHYYQRDAAISKTKSINLKMDILKVYKKVEKLLSDYGYSDISYWARGFYCHHASVIAELAREQRDKEILAEMQDEIKAYFIDYKRTNRKYPDKFKRIKKLLAARLVNLCEYSIELFTEQTGDKSIVCFGAYTQFTDWIMQNPGIIDRIVAVIDNDKSVQGGSCKIGDKRLIIVSPAEFFKLHITNYCIVINTQRYLDDIIKTLDLSGKCGDVDVYVAELKKYKDIETINKVQSVELEILDEFVRVCKAHNFKYYLVGGTLLGAIRHKGFIPWDDDIDVIMPAKDFEEFVRLPEQEFSEDFFLHWITTDPKCVDRAAHLKKHSTYRLGWASGFETASEMNNAISICVFKLNYTAKRLALGTQSFSDKLGIRIIMKLERIAYHKLGISLASPKTVLSLFSLPAIIKIRERVMKIVFKPEPGYWLDRPGDEIFAEGVPVEFEGRILNAPTDWGHYLLKMYGKDYMQLPPPEKRFSHCPKKLSFDVKSGIYEDM